MTRTPRGRPASGTALHLHIDAWVNEPRAEAMDAERWRPGTYVAWGQSRPVVTLVDATGQTLRIPAQFLTGWFAVPKRVQPAPTTVCALLRSGSPSRHADEGGLASATPKA